MMNKISVILFLLLNFIGYSQETYTISGIVSEDASGETLIGVNIIFPDIQRGTITNEYGFHSITLPKGTYNIEVSYIGYETIRKQISLTSNLKENFKLKFQSETIDEVVIKSNNRVLNLKKPEMSVHKISVNTIKEMPVVLGEVDIIKSIQLLPGVTSAGEGASGFNVRGGAEDQNLIMLDEATLYSSSHFFGFFSIFNADAIKDVKLYKGGIPAKYGGRVSSVLDVHQKDGNKKEHHFTGGIGLISSRLMAEGPIKENKSSYLIAGRGSYAHLFLKLNPDTKENTIYFYDLNTKLNFDLDAKNKLYFSGYFGRDQFNISNLFVNTYGNQTFNTRWNHIINDKLFSNLTLIYSEYNYFLNLDFVGFNWDSGIQNLNLKYDFKHYMSDDFSLSYGLNAIHYHFHPGEITPSKPTSPIQANKLDQKYAIEPALYAMAEHSLSDNFSMNYGLRVSSFFRMGGQPIYSYKNNAPIAFNEKLGIYEEGEVVGQTNYDRGTTVKTFFGLEPRISMSFTPNTEHAFKASYNRMFQYIHLISNTVSAAPLDVWTPSGPYIEPQILDQYALGYFKNLKDGDYSIETEVYYKDVQNRLDYRDGADLIAQNQIETIVLSGKSRSYGLELSLKKNRGNFKGWISYTLSNTEQKVVGTTEGATGINNGNWYKSPYHKLHDLSITTSYYFNKKWKAGANFVYQSGKPVTYPNGQFETSLNGDYTEPTGSLRVPVYSQRNQYKLPSYHHFDISATYSPQPKKTRKWKGEWVFSIYNLYGRKNAASISFGPNEDTGRNQATQTSIFGFTPSFTYNFKF
jgi:hypothetical protein